MAADVVSRPGGYSAGLVARLVANWQDLAGPDGRLPQRRHILATRRSKDRFGGAAFEVSGAYRVDLLSGLERLDPETRRVVELRMQGLTYRAMGQRLDVSYSTALRRADAAIGELTAAMNSLGGTSVPRSTRADGTNGYDPDKSLPDKITSAEQETLTLYDALDSKLERLPGHWRELRVKRGMRGTYEIAVVY